MPITHENNFYASFSSAVILHVILFLVMVITFHYQASNPALTAGPKIMQATAILQPMPNLKQAVTKTTPPPQAQKTPPPAVQKPVPKENTVAIQKRKQAEAQKAAELKRQADEKKKQAELDRQQQQKAAQEKAEQQQAAANQAKIMQGEVDKYKALIIEAIQQNWIIPPNLDKSLSAQLLIRLAPDGTVLEVRLTRSSGNDALDQSAITAVQKSSPLPVPNDLQAFKQFREIYLTVKPEGTISSSQ